MVAAASADTVRVFTPCEGGTSVYVSGNEASHGYPAWDMVCMDSEAVVTAPVTGRVVFVQNRIPNDGCRGLGNAIVIKARGDGLFYVVGHLARGSARVRPGYKVGHGRALATMGTSGQVTGAHVHVMRFTTWAAYNEENCGKKTVWGEGETPFCFHDVGCPSTGVYLTSGNYKR